MVFGSWSRRMAENPLSKLLRKEGREKESVEGKIKGRDGNVVEADFGGKRPADEYDITPVPGEETVVRRRKKGIGEEESVKKEKETIGDPLSEEKIDLK